MNLFSSNFESNKFTFFSLTHFYLYFKINEVFNFIVKYYLCHKKLRINKSSYPTMNI